MSAATVESIAPGIYPDIDAEVYHAGPGISSTQIKRLIPPSTPAHFRYGEFESSAALDFGKLAHRILLGKGDEYAVSPYDSFRTNEAKAWRAEQEANGVVVVTEDDLERAHEMARVVREHPLAGHLFTDGAPEQSLYWTDLDTGVLCRARYDWLRNIEDGRRLLIPDYKSARTAAADPFGRAAADFGYVISAAFYCRAAVALDLDPDPLFLLVVQEKRKPYLPAVYTPAEEDLQHANALIDRALRLYAECAERDEWPGYPATTQPLQIPVYHRIKIEESLYDQQ